MEIKILIPFTWRNAQILLFNDIQITCISIFVFWENFVLWQVKKNADQALFY